MNHKKILAWVLENKGFVAASKDGVAVRVVVAGKVFATTGKTIEIALGKLFEDLEEMYKEIQYIFKNDYTEITQDK